MPDETTIRTVADGTFVAPDVTVGCSGQAKIAFGTNPSTSLEWEAFILIFARHRLSAVGSRPPPEDSLDVAHAPPRLLKEVRISCKPIFLGSAWRPSRSW